MVGCYDSVWCDAMAVRGMTLILCMYVVVSLSLKPSHKELKRAQKMILKDEATDQREREHISRARTWQGWPSLQLLWEKQHFLSFVTFDITIYVTFGGPFDMTIGRPFLMD